MRVSLPWIVRVALFAVLVIALVPGPAGASVDEPREQAVSGGVWTPGPVVSWQWQIVGKVDRPFRRVRMYDIDLQDSVPSPRRVRVPGFGRVRWPRGDNPRAIRKLHRAGKVVICYLDTGAYESYRPDARLFPRSVIGNTTGWKGERWLDIRRRSWHKFVPIVRARLRLAKRVGCDGVEPDQNNPLGNRPGFSVNRRIERRWYLKVARMSHRLGLSVGMKNGVEVVNRRTARAFDWALNEECFYFRECKRMRPFIRAGKAVLQTEYVSDWKRRGAHSLREVARRVCRKAKRRSFSTLIKRHVPGPSYVACRR